MRGAFAVVIFVDLALLLMPTRWLGPRLEFWTAVTLLVLTALFWFGARVNREDY